MNAPQLHHACSPPLHVTFGATGQLPRELTFTGPFKIGRTEECEVCIKDDHVSRSHAEVLFEQGQWWVRDLNSTNGTFVNGQRVELVAIAEALAIRLGILGPEVFLRVEPPPKPAEDHEDDEAVVARLMKHYFAESANQPAGQHTMLVRKAYAQVQTKQRRKYRYIVGALLLCILIAGSYAAYEHHQVSKQRALAENLFYAMKSLDVDIAGLQGVVLSSNNPHNIEVIQRYQSRRKGMERDYDRFLATLHVYSPKMTEKDRLILRVARIFGECELDMPADFKSEVDRYIKSWQSSPKLAQAIATAKSNGYVPAIASAFLQQGLPPQYFYLALQESGFDPYISGPVTRKGIAKGMWQFIPETAVKYGLHVGPLVDLRRPDPADERHQWRKETTAAVSYINDLYGSDAQASGLLVMACYNWGEEQVLPLVRSMPANPRERNFWQLLARHREKIPQETYDYVFYIVSAAVIGENPRLFGFDFDNPLADADSHDAGNNPPRETPSTLAKRNDREVPASSVVLSARAEALR